jgi:hypothetical protein
MLKVSFDKFSGKIICLDEYSRRERRLMKEMSLGLRLFACLDACHQIFSIFKKLPSFLEDSLNTTVYQFPWSSKKYVCAEEVLAAELEVSESGFNKDFQVAALKCRFQAIEDCADYSHRVLSGELVRCSPRPSNGF